MWLYWSFLFQIESGKENVPIESYSHTTTGNVQVYVTETIFKRRQPLSKIPELMKTVGIENTKTSLSVNSSDGNNDSVISSCKPNNSLNTYDENNVSLNSSCKSKNSQNTNDGKNVFTESCFLSNNLLNILDRKNNSVNTSCES